MANRPPEEDLVELRYMFSGGRYAEASSLMRGLRWVLAVVVMGGGLMLLGVAYRGYSWLSAQWDPYVDAGRGRKALRSLRTAHAEQERRE